MTEKGVLHKWEITQLVIYHGFSKTAEQITIKSGYNFLHRYLLGPRHPLRKVSKNSIGLVILTPNNMCL